MSLIEGVSNAWNAATVSGLGRSISVRIRNPGPGCISADFGLPTISSSPAIGSGAGSLLSIGNGSFAPEGRFPTLRAATGTDDNVSGRQSLHGAAPACP